MFCGFSNYYSSNLELLNFYVICSFKRYTTLDCFQFNNKYLKLFISIDTVSLSEALTPIGKDPVRVYLSHEGSEVRNI